MDDNQVVNIFDMISIRQLILRSVDQLPNGNSWKFVDRDFVFSNPSNPWVDNFESYISANNLSGDKMDVDFIGVKLGDVDNSATANLNKPVEQRVKNRVDLVVATRTDSNADEIDYLFYPQEELDIHGFQFELNFDAENFEFITVVPGNLNLDESNLSTKFVSDGKLLISWNENDVVSVNELTSLFEFRFKQLDKAVVDPSFQIEETLLSPEIYLNRPSSIFELGLIKEDRQQDDISVQNSPNPFTHSTTVEFSASTNDPVEIKIFDLQGKSVHIQIIEPIIGKNILQYKASDFQGEGVYFLQLISGQKESLIKMILVK